MPVQIQQVCLCVSALAGDALFLSDGVCMCLLVIPVQIFRNTNAWLCCAGQQSQLGLEVELAVPTVVSKGQLPSCLKPLALCECCRATGVFACTSAMGGSWWWQQLFWTHSSHAGAH